MSKLDARGDISAAIIAIYSVILPLALLLLARRGLYSRIGWVFVILFSISRIVGGAAFVATELETRPTESVFVIAFVFQSVGLAPLLICTMYFLGSVVYSNSATGHSAGGALRLNLVHIIISVSVALSIVGAVQITSDDASTRKNSATFRKAGAIIFLVAYAALVFFLATFRRTIDRLSLFQRKALNMISLAFIPLGVRILYQVLSAFSPTPNITATGILPGSSSSLAKFNSFTGSWPIFLVMFVIMELLVASIYIAAGFFTPTYHGSAEGTHYGGSVPSAEYNQRYEMKPQA